MSSSVVSLRARNRKFGTFSAVPKEGEQVQSHNNKHFSRRHKNPLFVVFRFFCLGSHSRETDTTNHFNYFNIFTLHGQIYRIMVYKSFKKLLSRQLRSPKYFILESNTFQSEKYVWFSGPFADGLTTSQFLHDLEMQIRTSETETFFDNMCRFINIIKDVIDDTPSPALDKNSASYFDKSKNRPRLAQVFCASMCLKG